MAGQAGTTPSPTLASPARGPPRTYSDVSPEYVLGGSLAGLARVGERVVPACLATGRPGLGLRKSLLFRKILSKY